MAMRRSAEIIALALLAATLGGCATTRLIPPPVSGDADKVTVYNTWGMDEAWPLAVKHCAKYGKIPRKMRQTLFVSIEFTCVQQPPQM